MKRLTLRPGAADGLRFDGVRILHELDRRARRVRACRARLAALAQPQSDFSTTAPEWE